MPKKIEIVSATQVELFLKCPRLWYSKYIAREKQPESTPEMMEGLEVHQAIEQMLKHGPEKVEGRWAKLIQKLWNKLEELGLIVDGETVEGVFSEKQVRVRTKLVDDLPGPWFTGGMDIYDSRDSELPVIYDIKSKKDLKYTKSEFELALDIQLSVYALWVMSQTGSERVKLVHIYGLRDEESPKVAAGRGDRQPGRHRRQLAGL
jgi:CRISPR/Cas system-associated exonuclease Cas4 (RecB family)